MKKLMIVIILAAAAQATMAQVTIPKTPPIQADKIVKAAKVLESMKQPMIMESRYTNNYPDKPISVEASMSKESDKGYVFNFKSSFPIREVKIKCTEPDNLGGITSYGNGITSGLFYLEAPPYKNSGTVLLTFYAKGLELPVWQVLVQRKIPASAE